MLVIFSGSRPASGKPLIPTANHDDSYEREDNFMCRNCDKMYTRQRDLDIHMSYCTGWTYNWTEEVEMMIIKFMQGWKTLIYWMF